MERPKGVRNWKHGLAHTLTYKIWASMKGRCQNPKDSGYERYGSRGISVCERWQAFDCFFADMGEAPPGLSIDRIDNDGNYEPGNCRWATRTEQNNNSRNVHWIEHNGIRDNIVGWAVRLGCDRRVLSTRLSNGWPIADVLSPPFCRKRTKRNSRRVEFGGESLTVPEWAARTGIPRNVINYRLSAGWSVEETLTAAVDHNKYNRESRGKKN